MQMSARRYALLLAVIYFMIAILYILTSSYLAQAFAETLKDLWYIEAAKGFLFVVVTSCLLYFFSFRVLRRMFRDNERLLHAQRVLMQTERDAIAGVLASSLVHDFTNMLTLVRLNTEKLKSQLKEPSVHLESLGKIDLGITRLTELTDRMQVAGKSLVKERPQDFDVVQVAQESLDFLRMHEKIKRSQIEISASGEVSLIGYPILMHQIFMNLILNAAEATTQNSHIHIEISREKSQLHLVVDDNGPGIPETEREKVFDPFYTTKEHGTGLGLMSVLASVGLHNGSIQIEDSPLGGARFNVFLPDLELST